MSGAIIDITRRIHAGMAVYPANPAVSIEPVRKAAPGQSSVSLITLGSHTGTHIDAPSHIQAGAVGSYHYALDHMNGPAELIDLSQITQAISADLLPPTQSPRVLIKTTSSLQDPDVFYPDFIALLDSAATELVARGIILVGIDSPSIKPRGVHNDVHRILLEAGVIILEGLQLKAVESGLYDLICLPLAIDADGAPVRAALRAHATLDMSV